MKRTSSTKKTMTKLQAPKPSKYLCTQEQVQVKFYDLGFKLNFIKALIGTEPVHVWDYYKTEYSVQHVVDEIINNIESQDIDQVLNNMRKPFRILFSDMFKDLKDHYNVIHMIQIIIEYGNKQFDAITPNVFLYKPEIVNALYKYKHNDIEHNYFNASNEEEVQKAITLLNINETNTNYKMYYHATNWNALQDIMINGPDSREGRQCLDFGRTPSFYVTHDLHTAVNWCRRKRANFDSECGIIVFSLPTNGLPKFKSFLDANDEWKALVKDSRSCQKRNILDQYNFVYGPMLENVEAVKKLGVDAKAHTPIKWQLASKKSTSDEILKDCIVGAIFIHKQIVYS
jgi:hypothetical protein